MRMLCGLLALACATACSQVAVPTTSLTAHGGPEVLAKRQSLGLASGLRDASWRRVLADEFQKDYFHHLEAFLAQEKAAGHAYFPSDDLVFNAFNQTPFDDVKVVILGQDPYPGAGEAMGLSFSVNDGVKVPASLANIYKELNTDLGLPIAKTGNLTRWAQQGVLLLNTTMTVRAGEAGSHQKQGWETFTDTVIRDISAQKKGVVFLLWGKFAQQKAVLIDEKKHHILMANHPSPLAARNGFFGCRHFSQTNAILEEEGLKAIDWRLE
jgi:uracil-DNA glycosylase